MTSDHANVSLKEGYLKKRSKDSALIKNWRRRYFRVYAGELLYYMSSQDTTERRRIPLCLDTVVTKTNDQGYTCCLALKATPTGETFYMQAETEQEKEEWVIAIYEAARRTADVGQESVPQPIFERTTPSLTQPTSPIAVTTPARVLLQLNIVEARELMAADLNGKSDPYVVIQLLAKNGQVIRTDEMKTPYRTNTLDPVWNHHLTIGEKVDLRTVDTLRFELWDHDQVGISTQSIGSVQIPLSIFQMSPASAVQSELVDRWFRIEPPAIRRVIPTAATSVWSQLSDNARELSPFSTSQASTAPLSLKQREEKEEHDLMLRAHGELHIVMSITGPNLVDFFQTHHQALGPQNCIVTEGIEHTDNRLEVRVLAARHLMSADTNQSSDPYVELTLLDDHGKPLRGETYTTAVKYQTRHPAWEQEHYVFGRIRRIDEAAQLKVRVMDWDKYSANDPLGCVYIDLDTVSATCCKQWYDLHPDTGMKETQSLGQIELEIALIGETRGERQRRLKLHKEMIAKTHTQSMEQLELENAQTMLHDAACKLDGARLPCTTNDYQARHPQFYGINGCLHHLNTQIPRAHRDTKSSEEHFQARTGVEGHAQLEVTVVGTHQLIKHDNLTSANPYAVIEMDPPICVEETKRTSAPQAHQRSKRVEALNAAAADARNSMFSKRVHGEVSSHRTRLDKNEFRSETKTEGKDINGPVLKVEIKSGHGLSGVDYGGYSDPYCTLVITDRQTGKPIENEKKRTAVQVKTLNPVWEHEVFVFGKTFPLMETAMLLIHVKNRNTIGRSTPLGRVQIPILDLCRASVTTTSITTTSQEKRYALVPEPWMKTYNESLGELCIKTEITGDATALAEMIQRIEGSPDKMMSFLSMSSFTSDPYMSETLLTSSSQGVLTSQDEEEVTEIIEKGKVARTQTAVGTSAQWRREKFTLCLSYPGIFSETTIPHKSLYTLHLRIQSARRLLGIEKDPTDWNQRLKKHTIWNLGTQSISTSRSSRLGKDINAYCTIIPVLGNGQLEHHERQQSLTVYGTRHPNWPLQEFVFGKHTDISMYSYLSLHIYSRDVNEMKRPLSELLTVQENQQMIELKRMYLYKIGPSGQVEDDGMEILMFHQNVLAYRACGDGGRYVKARIHKYLPYPVDAYQVMYEDGIETIQDVWDMFSLDTIGTIKAVHTDKSVDVLLRGTESQYLRRIPISLLTPVETITCEMEKMMARRIDSKQLEQEYQQQFKHSLIGLQLHILSASGLPKGIQHPGCIVTLIGSHEKTFNLPSGTWNQEDLILFPLSLIELGRIKEDENDEMMMEGMETLAQTTSIWIRIVDQGIDETPLITHPLIGMTRIDLVTLQDGVQDLTLKLIPSPQLEYYKYVGQISIQIRCVDTSHDQETLQLNQALQDAGHGNIEQNSKQMTVIGSHAWYERRMMIEMEQQRLIAQSTRTVHDTITAMPTKETMTRIERRQVLRKSLTPTENAQIDAFHTVLCLVQQRVMCLLKEIHLFETFETLSTDEMTKYRHLHTIHPNSQYEWLGRMIQEIQVEIRKEIVVALEMELLDLAASSLVRIYPTSSTTREEWIQLRQTRQMELERVGMWFMKDRTNGLVSTLSQCFTGEGMISWILREPSVLWKEEWIRYCTDPRLVETCKLEWNDTRIDPDGFQVPRTRTQALIWLNALADAGYIEQITPGRYYLVEDRTDRYYRLRYVEKREKGVKSLFPLDLVREIDCYQQDVRQRSVTMSSPPPSPKRSPRKKPVSPTPTTCLPSLSTTSLHQKTYAKKLTDHLEGFVGMQNALSSALFHTTWPALQPVLTKTQALVPEQVLFDWKYCLFLPMDKCMYIYQRETSLEPSIIIDLRARTCYGAYGIQRGWFQLVNAIIYTKQDNRYVAMSREMHEKIMTRHSNGTSVLELRTEDPSMWIQAFLRADISIDMRPGQMVILKQLNPNVIHQKCIDAVTPYTSEDVEGSFQRLLNRFYHHDQELQTIESQLRDRRTKLRNEMKKSGKLGEIVMAYYNKGQTLDPKPTDARFFTPGALYSGRIVKIRTPFTDPSYRFTHLYTITEAPIAMQRLLQSYHVTDQASWLKLPKSLRDVFLLYDVEYRHAHEIIREHGLLREHIRMNQGDLDSNKVQERCMDVNLFFKPSDLEDCITRMVLHMGGRQSLGVLKIPIKSVSSHRSLDMWYPLAPEHDMLQKNHLGHVRIQLRLDQVPQLKRSRKIPSHMIQEIKEGMIEGKIEPLYNAAIQAASVAATNLSLAATHAWMDPVKFIKERSQRVVSHSTGFQLTQERMFIKITILEGRKLIAADYFTSDPFVKLVLVREDQREENTRLKTDIKTKTLSPKWINQEFILGKTEATRLSDKKAIILRVMDHDLTSADDPMGCLRIEFQRDQSGSLIGFILIHGDEKGYSTSRVLTIDGTRAIEVDERLLADEKAGQSKTAHARGNTSEDGKLGRLRFLIQVEPNEHYIDPLASPTSRTKIASMMKTLETKYSLEIAVKQIDMIGKQTTLTTDWRLYTCEFIPLGEAGQRIPYDLHSEELGRGNGHQLSDLITNKKILGRTYDMSKVVQFHIRVLTGGKTLEGYYRIQEKCHPQQTPILIDDIILNDHEGNKIQLKLEFSVIAMHRAERLKRLLGETFRLVGLQFDSSTINQSSVQSFLWEVGKVQISRSIGRELLDMMHRMVKSSKLHWKYTPQCLGWILEHVFAQGNTDRLSYQDAMGLDILLSRWSSVLHHVNEAKNQLIGHLHGKETPRVIQALLSTCDWTGFEWAQIGETSMSETFLRQGTRVHGLLSPRFHPGVAVDLKTIMGTYLAGTIVSEYSDHSYDVAFCASAKVHEEGDEYFSDEEELPSLLLGQTVFVCPFAKDEHAGQSHAHTHSREPGRIGKVVRYDETRKDAPYEIQYNDRVEPEIEWIPRMCLDSMFYHVASEDLSLQLARDDLVRVVGSPRVARIVKNHRTSRYDIEYVDEMDPKMEKQVVRERLEPIQTSSLYDGEIEHVYIATSDAKVHYDLVLKNGDRVQGIPRESLRPHHEVFASDESIVAAMFLSDLTVKDENSSKDLHLDMAQRVKTLWHQDQLIKLYLLLDTEPDKIYLRDSITNQRIQAKLQERNEKKPRFVDQCHGYTKGITSQEETLLTQIWASKHISKPDGIEFHKQHSLCLYLAPQPRLEIHGSLRITPVSSSKSYFKSLLQLAIQDPSTLTQMIQRLVRSSASEHMPLNRKERIVTISNLEIAFYRVPVTRVSINPLTSLCSGDFKGKPMHHVPLTHVSLRLGFNIGIPHNNRSSLVDALSVAQHDAQQILTRLTTYHALNRLDSSLTDTIGQWNLSETPSTTSVQIEFLDTQASKGSKPSITMELIPLDDQRLSIVDVNGKTTEVCLPLDRILVEAHLRRHVAPYYEATVVEGPIQVETQQVNRRPRRDSLLLSKPTQGFKTNPTSTRSMYKIQYVDTGKTALVSEAAVRYDTLLVQVMQASQLSLPDKVTGTSMDVELYLQSNDFDSSQQEKKTNPFGLVLSETGAILKDLKGRTYPRHSTIALRKQANDWIAPQGEGSKLSFAHPHVDMSRVSGLTINLVSSQKVIGSTFIPLSSIKRETPLKTVSLYRNQQVVGKLTIQIERTQTIQVDDRILAKRWDGKLSSMSDYEILALTLKQQENPLVRGLLASTSILPHGEERLLKDPIEQELQIQKLIHVMMLSHAMEAIYATKTSSAPLTIQDDTTTTSRVLDHVKQAVVQTKWLVEDTAAELGFSTTGKRLPWSSDPVETSSPSHNQDKVLHATINNVSTRLRRTMLKLYQLYRDRLIPTLSRLYQLDQFGDGIDMKAGQQLLTFFEDEVETLESRDLLVYRRVYQRIRLMKIAQVLTEIMSTTLRVTVMDQDPDLGDDAIGTAYIPLVDLLDQVEHDQAYELTKTRQQDAKGKALQPIHWTETLVGRIHLRLHLTYSESSLLEQATMIYKFLKTKYMAQHDVARRRMNAAVIPAQRRRWMTIKGYLEELQLQSETKLHWERTPVLLQLVWDIFSSSSSTEEEQIQGLLEQTSAYRDIVVKVHHRWVNLQPKLEELLQMQAATQLHATRTPQLLEEIEKEVEGLDLVLQTAWTQVSDQWHQLEQALEELVTMQERNKLHLARAPQLLHYITTKCRTGLNSRHAEAVANVQFRWMSMTQREGPLWELRVMEKKGLHWRRTHELILLLTEQCEGFADIDAKALEIVQKRWEQVQEWLDQVVEMQTQHQIDCEATPFILKKMHLMDTYHKPKMESKLLKTTINVPTSPRRKGSEGSVIYAQSSKQGGNRSGYRTTLIKEEEDVGRLEGLAEWYAMEEAKYELERIPYHRIRTDYERQNWLPYSQDGQDTRLLITQMEITLTCPNIRAALVDRGVIPHFSDSSELCQDVLNEIQQLEQAIETKQMDPSLRTMIDWNPERLIELYSVIESLGKSDLLWKIPHAVNQNQELTIPTYYYQLIEELKVRQIPTNEVEDLIRTLTVTLQKEELQKIGLDVPTNANFTTVLQLMHRHNVKDVVLPQEMNELQALLQERGMDTIGQPVYLRGMRIGTQSWNDESKRINTGLGIIDTQIETLRKTLLLEALRKRNSLIKTFPGESRILTPDELSTCLEVDMSGDYLTLIERFQQVILMESYAKRLSEYAAMDRCMRSLVGVSRDVIVTKEDIALALQKLKPSYRLPIEAFTREELLEAAELNHIRHPTDVLLARCPSGLNAKAMAYYAALSYAARMYQQHVSFRARFDSVTQRFVDTFPYEQPSSIDGMLLPKNRSRLNWKEFCMEWLLGSSESVIRIHHQMGEYHRQRLVWASAAFTLRNRWFHRGYGWCDDRSQGTGVKMLLQNLLWYENGNKMNMIQTEELLQELNDKCINLRTREQHAKETLETRYHHNLEMLERLVGQAEKCINNRKLHTEETPALLHAIEQECIVPNGLNARHKEAYHVVTSAWIPHRARLAELVQMHKEGTFSIQRTPELLSAMEFHTEGLAGAEELNLDKVLAVANASHTSSDVQQQYVDKKVDEIRRGQRKQPSCLQLELLQDTERDQVDEEMKQSNEESWQSLSPSKRMIQPLSPQRSKWAMVTTTNPSSPLSSPSKLTIKIERKSQRLRSVGDEFMEILKSPSKWLLPTTETSTRIPPQQFFPDEVTSE